jgi:hypothetical protein
VEKAGFMEHDLFAQEKFLEAPDTPRKAPHQYSTLLATLMFTAQGKP